MTFQTASTNDTLLALMEGRCLVETVRQCVDDTGATDLNARLTVTLEANETAFLALDLFEDQSGAGTLTVTAAAAP